MHHNKKSKLLPNKNDSDSSVELKPDFDEEPPSSSCLAERQQEVFSLLSSFRSLFPMQQNCFLSHLIRTLSLDQIHLLLRKLHGLMTVDFIGTLPPEVSLLIMSFLDSDSLYNMLFVSRQWYEITSQSDEIWKYPFLIDKTSQCQCEEMLVAGLHSHIDNSNIMGHPKGISYRSLFRRHMQIQRNWANGKYKLINVVCNDVGVITTIQFDKDKIIFGTDDGHVLLANPKSGQIMMAFTGHTGGVWALQYVGNMLVTGSTDRTIRIWSIRDMRLLYTLYGHRSTVRCLGITHDGRFIISGSRDKSVKIWNAKDGTLLHSFNDHHSDSVRCLALKGFIAVTGSYDCTLRVWDIEQGICLHHLVGHKDKIYSVAFDGQYIVSGGHTGSTKVWDFKTGSCIFNLIGHCSLVSNIVITPDAIVTGSTDCTVRHWHKQSGALLAKYFVSSGSVSALAADEHRMLTGSDSSLRFWNLKTGNCIELLPDVNVIWRVEMNESMCVATGDSIIEFNGNRMNSSTLHIFNFE